MVGALIYRRLASPLHAVRAWVGALWVGSLAVAALVLYHPLVLATITAVALGAGAGARVGRQELRAVRLATMVALPIVAINVLISRNGLTVFARLGGLGPFGQLDLTVEALVYGAVIALKVGDLILLSVLASLAVDPDELLALCRRLSFRSALTVSLAVRMVPLLAADTERLAAAQRTRPEGGVGGLHGRALLLGASVGSAIDRAMDLAATLELRGLASPSRARGGGGGPLSRHDIAFLCSAASVVGLAIAGRVSGMAFFNAYPLLDCPVSPGCLVLCATLAGAALAPFADRRGVRR